MNSISILGRLTAHPELKHTTSGKEVTSFTLAIDRPFSKDGERQTDFIPCVAWGKTATIICKYFRKGQRCGLEGRIQSRSYEDKNGNKRTAIEVVTERVHFIEKKSDEQPEIPAITSANEFTQDDVSDYFQDYFEEITG